MSNSHLPNPIWLNVGGEQFCCSIETLTWHDRTFFSGLFREGGVGIKYDQSGKIFIDRDPDLFRPILHFLRTRRISIPQTMDVSTLLHEVEFYGVSEMSSRLSICTKLNDDSCGGIHFSELLRNEATLNDPVCAIAGNGPMIAVAHTRQLDLFYFDEHHGWNLKASQQIQNQPDKISLKFISQKKTCGVNCYIAYSHESKINLFKVWEDEVIELEGHDFSISQKKDVSASPSISVKSDVSGDSMKIEHLKFIGTQLLAVSENSENMAVWNAARQGRWQQHKVPEKVLCLESVSTFVYLGSDTGRIHYTDLQKFPLRTKDNSLLVTELHSDPLKEPITALSVSYERNPIVEKTDPFDSLELCYGTANGTVRVLVQSPEHNTYGLRSLQLLQTYKVHCSPIISVELSEKFLISLCRNYHVRTWAVTRFRGVLSTQPGSAPYANFNLTTQSNGNENNERGPFGDGSGDEIPIFIQQPIPFCDTLFIRSGDKGCRLASLQSVTGSAISTYSSHDFESLPRMGLKPFRLAISGHLDGSVQVWDLTNALEQYHLNPNIPVGDLTCNELINLSQRADESRAASNCINKEYLYTM